MQSDPSHNVADRVPWLPGETFRFALDAKKGLLTEASASAALIVTSHRVITVDRRLGRRATTIAPLGAVSAVEITEASRPVERLSQGLIALGAGLLLAWVTWALFSAPLITVVVGGLPILASVYILLDYVFPNAKGELTLHAPGVSIRCALQSREAQRDAYAAAHRLSALQAGVDLAEAEDSHEEAASDEEAPPAEAPLPRRSRRVRRRGGSSLRAGRRVRGIRRSRRARTRAERPHWQKRAPTPQLRSVPPPKRRGGYVRRRLLRRLRLDRRASEAASGGGKGVVTRLRAIAGQGLPAAERLARRVLPSHPI